MAIDSGEMLTDAGRADVEALAWRHGVGTGAIDVLLRALERGGGEQAQFSHPELGGMGQWSRGGMIMVGDMFDNTLKARVAELCRDTAALLDKPGVVKAGRDGSGERGAWWPEGCGRPSATGAQNDRRYACFPDTRRLAVGHGDHVELYETGEHRIHGVSQQQGGDDDLRFTSQIGTVALHDLKRIGADERGGSKEGAAPPPDLDREPLPEPTSPPRSNDADVLGTIERLHALQRKGILTEAEFAEKKTELLARI